MDAYPTLKAVTPFDDYRFLLTFGENERRMYDFKPILSHAFYKVLADIKLFKSVSVNDGEIGWV
ncbi:MAG: DUF2442 domain-containing protein [Peptococcaceae bacterium]|jgi:hypothetical protein|nr:DUF2442 domain-containing protein [Peptococcaceae bacterium]